MSVNIIERAKQQKANVEKRLQELQEAMELARREAMEWEAFIEKAMALASGTPLSATTSARTSNGQPIEGDAGVAKVKVQRESWAGWSAKLILEKGPMSTKNLVEALANNGRVSETKNIVASLNSAMWRRKDLFEKREGRYHLLTKEIEFTDDGTPQGK